MKVSGALNFFSHSVSSRLRYLVENEGYDRKLLTTAWFIDLVDKWFNLMSSRHPSMALSKLHASSNKEAISHLKEVVWVFHDITIGYRAGWKPVETGVILSTTTIFDLQSDYLAKGHKYLLTSRFTQDCLENLFSSIRMKKPVPTAIEFRQTLKLISVAQFLICSQARSYTGDDREFLADFLEKSITDVNGDANNELEVGATVETSTENVIDQSEVNSLHYLAGYCIKKVEKCSINCPSCLLAVEGKQSSVVDLGSDQKLTQLKEYKENGLVYCTDECMSILKSAEIIFRQNKSSLAKKNNLVGELVHLAECQTESVLFPSCHNIKKKLLKHFFTLRMQIYARKEAKKKKKRK